MKKNNSIVKKIINDFKGKGEFVKIPFINKYSNSDVNICKFSGLVTVVKRRNDKKIAEEWSKKSFQKNFLKQNTLPAYLLLLLGKLMYLKH